MESTVPQPEQCNCKLPLCESFAIGQAEHLQILWKHQSVPQCRKFKATANTFLYHTEGRQTSKQLQQLYLPISHGRKLGRTLKEHSKRKHCCSEQWKQSKHDTRWKHQCKTIKAIQNCQGKHQWCEAWQPVYRRKTKQRQTTLQVAKSTTARIGDGKNRRQQNATTEHSTTEIQRQ